ncbi:MAG: hypothetical protein ABSA70_10340, partial [Terriglobia bacterium]
EIGVTITTLLRFFRNRWSRPLAVWCLIFIQAQLLWVAESHHHEEDQIVSGHCLVMQRGDVATQRAVVRPSCVACQIGWQNVARPAAGFPAAPPASVLPFLSTFSLLDFGLSRLTIVPARAPPVL